MIYLLVYGELRRGGKLNFLFGNNGERVWLPIGFPVPYEIYKISFVRFIFISVVELFCGYIPTEMIDEDEIIDSPIYYYKKFI